MTASGAANATVLSTYDHSVSTAVDNPGAINRRFHLSMTIICSLMFAIAIIGRWYTGVWDFDTLPAAILLVPASIIPAMYWHDKKRHERQDAAQTLY